MKTLAEVYLAIVIKNTKKLETFINSILDSVVGNKMKYKYNKDKMLLETDDVAIAFNAHGALHNIWIGADRVHIPHDYISVLGDSFSYKWNDLIKHYQQKERLDSLAYNIEEESKIEQIIDKLIN